MVASHLSGGSPEPTAAIREDHRKGDYPMVGRSITRLWFGALAAFIILAAAAGTRAEGQQAQPGICKNITPVEAAALIQQHKDQPDFALIDVRTPEDFAAGHIEKAINLDYYAEKFREELDKLPRTGRYLVYCQSGRRSEATMNIMKDLGFQEVYNITGGMTAWKAEGLPVVT